MKKVEADTLEEAYQKAATQLACSITDLEYEVIQHPSKGILGFLKKKAIIVATCKETVVVKERKEEVVQLPSEEESVASEIMAVVKDESVEEENENISEIIDHKKASIKTVEKDVVLDNFFAVDQKDETVEEETLDDKESEDESVVYDELALLIENQIKELLSHSCFDIDVVEVDVRDNTALIFIDGNDAALLIGKEGYRYNALSYMLFNWLHTKYELFIKLEIAEFLTSQQEMIRNYIKPVIENVEKHGKGKTRSLDGILVQIALEQLREAFPNKYVAVKTGREGNKFVVINEFNNKSHA
ncbi:MAG: Jag N-terminal domain-containing protein [Sulfurovum sp.]|nr:Jag N-terminal domain-containing protein [Sulfurovum sp.]